jgi:hypothetical protein
VEPRATPAATRGFAVYPHTTRKQTSAHAQNTNTSNTPGILKYLKSVVLGIQLADADLTDFEAAIAILPDDKMQAGAIAVFIEIGIVAAKHIPLLVLVQPEKSVPTALATIRYARASIHNHDALELHINLFVRSLGSSEEANVPAFTAAAPLSSEAAAAFQDRLRKLRSSPNRGMEFETFVADLLRACGAQVEAESRLPTGRLIDVAAVIPGEEQRLGVLLVEAKSWRAGEQTERTLDAAESQLQSYVIESGGGLGLLVYDPALEREPHATTPLILALPAERLIADLEVKSLSEVLLFARNEAIHRMLRCQLTR